MPRDLSHLGGPPELRDSIKDYFSHNALPTCGVYRLLWLAREGHGDFTWGFRIYRTTYNQPDSDAKFAKAIEVLNEYIRHACLSYDEDSRNASFPDQVGKANQQLCQRLRHDIVEDRELLEGASETPEKIIKLAQDWIHYDQKAIIADSPRYRFFLVFDDEVIDHLLQLPIPANHKTSIPAVYSVKVYDTHATPRSEFSGGEYSSDEDGEDYDEDDGYEGWFWSPASMLPRLWFCEYQTSVEELMTWDYSWDNTKRFLYVYASTRYCLQSVEA